MSNFLTRLFRRSKIDGTPSPGAALPPPPNPYDLLDWRPRASSPARANPEVPRETEPASGPSRVASTPVSDALATFRAPPGAGRGPSGPPTRPPSGAPPVPPPPIPKPQRAQIRLLMEDGTVVQVAGDPELERRIAYLATNLFSPIPEPPAEEAIEPPAYDDSEYIDAAYLDAEYEVAESHSDPTVPEYQEQYEDFEPIDPEGAPSQPGPVWPLVRLVFSDGTEASLPRDQEILDRLSYVVTNLLPARPAS